MGSAKVIPQDIFDNLELDAGVLLFNFDPQNPAINDSDIITATTGGIKIDAVPTYSDLFSDVDNAPANTKEGKHLDDWTVTVSTTALSSSLDMVKFAMGAADRSTPNYSASTDTSVVAGKTYYTQGGTSPNYTYTAVTTPTGNPSTSGYYEKELTGAVTPRRNVKLSDFQDIWYVGDLANGDLAVAKIMNALSTGGFGYQTAKNGKGQTSLTITGHFSATAQNVVPVQYMIVSGE